ncbi:damage-inducible protein DinB [Roseobacter sp. YSTF-M11]|uniref:Damage-inducible protein DinB n=2 Tax=Roseobacter insulae TaxID=2859783 RepID=A0A9X1K315_9RHOB|nr:damage-inducible protein DinB [Roseobacter insulae]
MARYNAWQNDQLKPVLEAMSPGDLAKDRGAFFGGLLATANHLLWADTIWLSRFDPSMPAPEGGIPESVDLHPTISSWAADRFRVDGKIRFWAEGLRALDLKGELTWFSGALGREVTAPMASTVMHFFNHQTHHRGQLHAMLTAAGQKAPVSDLFIMPKEA